MIRYATQNASASDIEAHLRRCSDSYVPPLASRVDLKEYSAKLATRAATFEAWDDRALVGLVAAYEGPPIFISDVSVDPEHGKKGIASALIARCFAHFPIGVVRLEAAPSLRTFYERNGFSLVEQKGDVIVMEKRDFDREVRDTADHKYAYNFDFDVMHPYMIRAFEPHFRPGRLLELGSFQGAFTERFLGRFKDITCVEASGDALAVAKQRLGDKVTFVHGTFEQATLPHRYENIVMTHVLEHLDDPVRVLRRIKQEWLADGGRFFLVCPNANAASRQIAVKMGLISHNSAVTEAERAHGHRVTYSLDTLAKDATAAGFSIALRTGIFFKALANFQWDKLLKTDIVSKEYLDGCFELGKDYPDLCASVFLLCQ